MIRMNQYVVEITKNQILWLRAGQCLFIWLNDDSNGVKSFVLQLDFVPIDTENKGFDPT